ncbi:MAG: hypothetical protein ABIX01_22085 [Chitinophagaceae bacterium]
MFVIFLLAGIYYGLATSVTSFNCGSGYPLQVLGRIVAPQLRKSTKRWRPPGFPLLSGIPSANAPPSGFCLNLSSMAFQRHEPVHSVVITTLLSRFLNAVAGFRNVASGSGNVAPDSGNVAFGFRNVASGFGNVAPGSGNVASGSGNVAFGFRNVAPGSGNVAFGFRNVAFGFRNVGPGSGNVASGFGNVASGSGNVAFGFRNIAFGFRNVAPGSGNVASGSGNVASGSGNVAFGFRNVASGPESSFLSPAIFLLKGYSDEAYDYDAKQCGKDRTDAKRKPIRNSEQRTCKPVNL